MIVTVLYYDPMSDSYCGNPYTYYCNFPVVKNQKVLAPCAKNGTVVLSKAIIWDTDLPESVIKDEWKYKVKEIKELDKE